MTNSPSSTPSSSKKASKPKNKNGKPSGNQNGSSAATNGNNNAGTSPNGQPKRKPKQKKRDDSKGSVEKMLYPDMFDDNNKLIARPVTAPTAIADGQGYAGSSFHESPAASSLPRPAFRGNLSPRQQQPQQQQQGGMPSRGFQSPPPAMPMQAASPPGPVSFGGPIPGFMGHAPPMYGGYGMPMAMPMGMPMGPQRFPQASPHMYAMPNMHASAGTPYGVPHPQSAPHYNYPPMSSSSSVPLSPHSRTAQQA